MLTVKVGGIRVLGPKGHSSVCDRHHRIWRICNSKGRQPLRQLDSLGHRLRRVRQLSHTSASMVRKVEYKLRAALRASVGTRISKCKAVAKPIILRQVGSHRADYTKRLQ